VDALGQIEATALLRPAYRALRRGEPGSRVAAAGILARVKDDTDVLRPLMRSAVLDRAPDVRSAASEALRTIGNPDVVRPLARAMWSALPEVRGHAAEALGTIGGASAVEWLITRCSSSGGPGGRANLFVGTQVTYVSDFDVEIAQAAQIGDPIVQTIREGVMLDTRIINVREEFTIVERREVFRNLTRITGKEFGEDARAWRDWYETEGRKQMTAAR
jgi:HEAT repeat protein